MAKKTTTPAVIDITPETPAPSNDVMTTEVEKVATETGMQLTEAQNIGAAFAPYMERVTELTNQINSIPTENPTTADAALARKLRLELVSNRGKNGLDSVHKDLKASILVRQRAVDGLKNFVENSSKIAELRAEGIEKHSERVENARLDIVEGERLERLAVLGAQVKYGVNIRLMDDEVFEQYYEGEKMLIEAIERDRLAAEKAECERAELIKNRVSKLVDAGFSFDGNYLFIKGTPVKYTANHVASLNDADFKLLNDEVKDHIDKQVAEQKKRDDELKRLQDEKAKRDQLLMDRFTKRSADLTTAGFTFAPNTKLFTNSTPEAHSSIPSSTIVNMEDKQWKEYLKSVVDAVSTYKSQRDLTDKLTFEAGKRLTAMGFELTNDGFQNNELGWFIGMRHIDSFKTSIELDDYMAQQQLQHAKLTQAKIDADAAKVQREKDEKARVEADKISKGTDQQKVSAFYAQFKDFKFPTLTSANGVIMQGKVNHALVELKKLIISEAKNLV